jgi:hypothetical protein
VPGGRRSAHSRMTSTMRSRMSLRAFGSTAISFQIALAMVPSLSQPAIVVARIRSQLMSRLLRAVRRSRLGSSASRTALMSPSSAVPCSDVHALNQTVETCGSPARLRSNFRMSVLLPLPHPASIPSVKGVDACEDRMSVERLSAIRSNSSGSSPSACG